MAGPDPGNLNRGMCLKCKTPMMIEMPDDNAVRILCLDCTREVQEFIRTSKSNKNLKRIVLHSGTFKTINP